VAFSLGLPVGYNNPVPANQVRFQPFRAIERICVEEARAAIRGAL